MSCVAYSFCNSPDLFSSFGFFFRCLQHWRECRELLFVGAVATPLSSPWVPWLVLVQWQVWLPAGVAGRRAGKNCTWVFGRIGRQVARIAMSRTTGLHDEI